MLTYILVSFYLVVFMIILINLLGGCIKALQIMLLPMIILSILIGIYRYNVTISGIMIFFIIVVNLMGVAVIVVDILDGYKNSKLE